MTAEKSMFEQNAHEQSPQTDVAKVEDKEITKSAPKKEALTPKVIGERVLSQINGLCEMGLKLPEDYNATNAIKAAMLVLEQTQDKQKRPVLQVCTPASISQSLFAMAVKGLDASLAQCYFIAYGEKLTLMESYFGKILRVKRIFPDYNPIARVIREGDVFEFETDVNTGINKLIKHEAKLENMDKDFIGGYCFIPTPQGNDLYIMTKKQITSAWMQGSNGGATAKKFDEKMIKKTLLSTGLNVVLNSTPTQTSAIIDQIEEKEIQEVDFVDVTEVQEIVDSQKVIKAPAKSKKRTELDSEKNKNNNETSGDEKVILDDHDF